MTGIIKGTGAYIPEYTLGNRELEKLVETSDEWIQERTGIQRRHIAAEETTALMAARAAKEAIEQAELEPEQIDMILVSTMSSEEAMPCTACRVQNEIGASHAVCFDLNAACSGFIMAYATACAYIEAGLFRNILVIGSERLSRVTNWSDRGTCILFGDGAGAVVVAADEGQGALPVLGSDGTKGDALTLNSGQNQNPFFSTLLRKKGSSQMKKPYQDAESKKDKDQVQDSCFIQMDGQEVFKFAARKVPEAIEEVLGRNKLRKGDVKYYILHQANKRIVEAVAKRIGEPAYKFPMNMQEYGNTSSASIPILLWEMQKKNMLRPGDRLVLAGFGGGLTWGAVIITWR